MAEWTPEARDYLEGYLRQVSALARQQGDDADEIVSELRGHIQREAEEAAGVMVTLDVLRKTLSAIGTPEQVAGVEAALTPPWRERLRAAEEKSPAPRTGQGAAAVPVPPLQSDGPAPRTSGLATASLILGLLSFLLSILASIPAIICGVLALRDIRKSHGQLKGQGLAISGILIGVVFPLILPAMMLPTLARAREAARRASCANNLKQMGLIYKMFSNETKGRVYPELSSEPGRLMCSAKDVYPEYLTDPFVLVCPGDPDHGAQQAPTNAEKAVDDQSYVYLGYVITSDDEMEAFAEVYKQRVAQGLRFNEDLKAPPRRGSMGTDTFYRLREGVERLFIADHNNPAASAEMQSRIPVMWDKTKKSSRGLVFNHAPGSANVLFMDGHVEYMRRPNSWPLTERASQLINELDTLHP